MDLFPQAIFDSYGVDPPLKKTFPACSLPGLCLPLTQRSGYLREALTKDFNPCSESSSSLSSLFLTPTASLLWIQACEREDCLFYNRSLT